MSGLDQPSVLKQEYDRRLRVPVWERVDALPKAPDDAPFGLIDHKSTKHTADSLEELVEKAESSQDGIDLVWAPDDDYCRVPEELPELHSVLRRRGKELAKRDISDGIRLSAILGLVFVWTLYAAWNNGGGTVKSLYASQVTGLAALLLLIFGLVPLYEGFKARIRLQRADVLEEEIPEGRFDAWLHRCRIPVTWGLVMVLGIVHAMQLWIDGWGGEGVSQSIQRVGQLKSAAIDFPQISDAGAWWRVLTAGLLHGNAVHFLVNAAGILYLGRRTEALARWPHLLIVFLSAMWLGGLSSAWLIPDKPAVGASGGLMGLLGFMLMFESLHRKLVPRPARRRLIAGVVLMGVMGFLGMSFIDNAAHVGGLLTGMVYAVVVFPKSTSAMRPSMLVKDRLIGAVAALVLIGLGCFACFQMIHV